MYFPEAPVSTNMFLFLIGKRLNEFFELRELRPPLPIPVFSEYPLPWRDLSDLSGLSGRGRSPTSSSVGGFVDGRRDLLRSLSRPPSRRPGSKALASRHSRPRMSMSSELSIA